jgi:hypothetical protein
MAARHFGRQDGTRFRIKRGHIRHGPSLSKPNVLTSHLRRSVSQRSCFKGKPVMMPRGVSSLVELRQFPTFRRLHLPQMLSMRLETLRTT